MMIRKLSTEISLEEDALRMIVVDVDGPNLNQVVCITVWPDVDAPGVCLFVTFRKYGLWDHHRGVVSSLGGLKSPARCHCLCRPIIDLP